jgi:hypothetical protein
MGVLRGKQQCLSRIAMFIRDASDSNRPKAAQVKYDPRTTRACVGLRDQDDDGSDVTVVAIFSFQTTQSRTKHRIEQEVLKKALSFFRKAGVTLGGG